MLLLCSIYSRSEDFDKARAVVADRARRKILAAYEAGDLMTAGSRYAVNLAVETYDARVSVAAAGAAASARHAFVHQNVIRSQAAGFRAVVKARVIPTG